MKIGISLTSGHDFGDPRLGARYMVERAAAARRAGLDSLFVGDHHATPGTYYQNVPIMGRLLAEWGDAPAGCLFLLPLWNPLLVAEQVGTLAAIAQGRFILQCGLGYGEEQFLAMGANVKHRPSAFEQAFDAVRRLLAGETVTSSGRFTFEGARVTLRPAEPVEYWIGASAPPAIDRAARIAEGWLGSPGTPFETAREQVTLYLERCAAHRRKPTAVALRRDIYVGESTAEAERVVRPLLTRGYRGFPAEAAVFGSIDDVVRQFRALAEIGCTDVIVRHLTSDQPKVLASLGRLAEVRQALQDA
jgi:alkanesulfonate monooxygenase SsuD/methylene tetrahydromethanopterin reductase-like flavin-dependent oxidoreductase (luciferase family)